MAFFNLDQILNLEKWQDLQDSLAEVTKLAIITVNYKGAPITTHSKCTPFCQKIRADEEIEKRCHKCDSRAGLEATRINEPYIYLCHYNIIDIAIPITIDDKYIGAVMAGQVRPVFADSQTELERILHSTASMESLAESAELRRLYEQIPVLNYEDILQMSEMLFKLCNYIVEEATARNILADMQEHQSALQTQPPDGISVNAKVSDASFEKPKNVKLLPALEYIYSNTHLMISLEKCSQLCNLSPGYFSRCFTREFGVNYSSYMNRLKIDWAKKLLTETDLPITQISDQLGFNDPGYFIKVFKKLEYVTPAMYRRYALE
ncbi:ligand-binding sensor protein [Lachnospiraceae bacterium PF1-21]|uniref:PocR ligand-binding domain-containing protein n=1 Tax=Ohessyouella blattaphilus TaxID=2949333 RepID=A0ABT1EGZ2_9FIRM|nr:PocR ligand-binding domain-containing protein [Ohessyouella blattaphilus]MCP1109987.1 PocR ligand-binding domain-containing protein [Ohessyouella blattaphilus]MCR8563381.1 PocR ligand-binding domain-containing protein [Ohessyouella blattaphilus]MDL2250904.1 PocR ligand-binding domain-containing protein [Lachnospiraceae bacterium OttesenSCG-928-J05]